MANKQAKVMQNKNEFKHGVKKSMIARYKNFECNELFCMSLKIHVENKLEEVRYPCSQCKFRLG